MSSISAASENPKNVSRPIDRDTESGFQAAPRPAKDTVFEQHETKLSYTKEVSKNYDWEGSWIWEIGCAILSVIYLALLIGFLGYVDGKPYLNWQYSISPNAVISVIATFAKSAMLALVSACLGQLKWKQGRNPNPTQLYHFHLLDQASRGPWGSLKIFWHLRSFLALAGAALMVLAVVIDPFTQQILAFPSRRVQVLNETAYVYKAQEFHTKFHWSTFQMDDTMQIAMFNGLARTSVPLDPICPSESCDYPEFTTLGICASCEDVTETATQDCRPIPSPYSEPNFAQKWANWHEILSSPTTPFLRKMAASIPIDCHYSTSNGFTLTPNTSQPSTSNGTIQIYRDSFIATTSSTDLWDIAYVSMAKYNSDTITYTTENMSVSEQRPQMTQCSIQFCEKQYAQNLFSKNSTGFQPSKSQVLQLIDHNTGNRTLTLIPRDGGNTLSDNSTYTIERLSWLGLSMHLGRAFNTVLNRFDGGAPPSVVLATILYNSDNITKSFSSMATSMTDNIRSGIANTQVGGRVYKTETFIHVRWLWAILPIVTAILSIFLFMATAIVNRGQPVLWKSSVFPLFMGLLQVAPEHEIANLRHLDHIQSMSKEIKIVVEGGDNGPLLFSER
ncbi:hypothetical protein N7517_006804 [Penicillium concentricum]|uniref:Uncharacterized protein n=1 Tax=Penicillium concentricum TaxID=293559 RepID=A0A9W9VAB9_9EURO|nr:uncharacterized protein N7517_006804 [Penicillium concentricum]KAJ5374798.1 hypothetical protein N7517_006804 [Penicillium concentricum]